MPSSKYSWNCLDFSIYFYTYAIPYMMVLELIVILICVSYIHTYAQYYNNKISKSSIIKWNEQQNILTWWKETTFIETTETGNRRKSMLHGHNSSLPFRTIKIVRNIEPQLGCSDVLINIDMHWWEQEFYWPYSIYCFFFFIILFPVFGFSMFKW